MASASSLPAPVLAGTTMCGRCGTLLSFPPGERSVSCPLCHAVTRVQRRGSGLEDFLKGLIFSLMSAPKPAPSSSVDSLPGSYTRNRDRKRALLVGIRYHGTKHELDGTHNDVDCMRYLLRERFGFGSDNILVLTEGDQDPYRVPTLKNLRLAMRWLVRGCDTGDTLSLVFHFAGRSLDGALCALDFVDGGGGMMAGNEINETIVRPLGPGVKLHAILDTDNNGTLNVLDLPYICRNNRTGSWQWENQNREPDKWKGTTGGLAISISGSRDSLIPGTGISSPIGAITYCFAKAVETEPETTYGRVVNVIRAGIRRDLQLSAAEAFDIHRKPFVL